MAVPDFQSLMMPLLRIAADGRDHSLAEARDVLVAELSLSEADREERLPSGRQSKFANRVAWAKVYLQQAGLLLSLRRGHFQISDRGRDVLKAPPQRIDIKFLEQYPEFVEFRTHKADVVEVPSEVPSSQPERETPEEALEGAYLKLRLGLASELLITTGTFSAEATAYVDRIDPKVVLIDGRRLAELMIDSDLGVNTAAAYNVKRVDSDYFDETGAV